MEGEAGDIKTNSAAEIKRCTRDVTSETREPKPDILWETLQQAKKLFPSLDG